MTSGTVTNGTFYARGNLAAFNGTLMDCPVDADCGYIRFSGSTFNSTVTATDQGVATGTGAGGCTFNDDVTIIHGGNGTYFTLANTTGDVFNADLTVINYSSHEVHLSNTSSTQYKGNLMLSSTGTGGITFGNSGGTSTLDSGKTITIGSTGFTNDVLLLKNFTQLGNTAQILTLTGTAVASFNGSTFNGEITVSSPGILLKNSTFNGMSNFTKTGTSNAQSDGGNVFNYATTISNTAASGRIRMATVSGDTYNADATFNSTGQDVQIAYSGDNTFAGNITINSNKVVFNTSTGKVTFTGINNQTLNGSYNYPFKKLAINKSAGTVTANTTLSVDDSLIFIQGNLITTSTNLLTMKHGSTATGASNSSFVSGPVKKIGDSTFVFDVGSGTTYRPLTITAPSNTSDAFISEFKLDSILVNSENSDSTLGLINRNDYWKLNRVAGASQVYVTLSWDSLNALSDTFVSVATWNGSKWINLGKSSVVGTNYYGTMKSAISSSTYNEFSIGYLEKTAIQNAPSCNAVTNAVDLQFCLNHTFAGAVIVAGSFDIPSGGWISFPMQVKSNVTLRGGTLTTSTKWYEPGCPLITTGHKSYMTNTNQTIRNLFLFSMQPGSSIEGLRIRGASCNLHDFNGDPYLCGGIYVENSSGAVQILDTEVACFSYAGIFKRDNLEEIDLTKCYIHKIKGKSIFGIGYGTWLKGNNSVSVPQEHNYSYCIFDDCKAGIDGDGDPIDRNILNCSFTQFSMSEEINMHNDNSFHIINNSGAAYHYCYNQTFPYGFYGDFCNNITPPCVIGTGSSSCTTFSLGFINGPNVPMYDIGGATSTIQNCIFHKKWGKSSLQSNINLLFPNRDLTQSGLADNGINVTGNTFAADIYDPVDMVTFKNRGGFARISDNYIKSWPIDAYINYTSPQNSFNYTFGKTMPTIQPAEMHLDLLDNSNVQLPETFNKSITIGKKKIQYIDLSQSFKLSTVSSDSRSLKYIVRPNPNANTFSSPVNNVISNENYFHMEEFITDNSISTIAGYDKPGLYGIDVLAFDEDFRASAWHHIPLIVRPVDDQKLYFNIKDSYTPQFPITTTQVYKQAEINGNVIWKENIAVGGEGWEYVEVDLKGNVDGTATPILSILNTDGQPNKLTFSIYVDGSNQSTMDVRGVLVAVDDIYIKKTNSATGENLIFDGSIELSKPGLSSKPSDSCFWFHDNSLTTFPGCDYLSKIIEQDGIETEEDQLTYVDGNKVASAASDPVSAVFIGTSEKKSGSQSLTLILPALIDCNTYPITSGEPIISVSTYFDFTDLISCDNVNPNATNVLGFQPFPTANNCTSGVKYYIDQDVEVTNSLPLTFLNNDVAIAPDVKIVVKNGATFTIDNTNSTGNSHLFGCSNLWQGIVVESGGKLIIDGNVNNNAQGALIEDSKTAITCTACTLSVEFANFNNNFKSIDINGGDYYSSNNSQYIYGSRFQTSDDLIRKAPYADQLSPFHVRVTNATGLLLGNAIPPQPSFRNVFEGGTVGIIIKNSDVNIINSDFKSIYNEFELQNKIDFGTGILISNRTTSANIKAVSISGNTFEKVNIGIHASHFAPGNILEIADNIFDNSQYIPHALYSPVGTINSFYNTAITIQNPIPNTGDVSIVDNQIMQNRIGIHAINIPDVEVGAVGLGNSIEFDYAGPTIDFHEGIWLQACDRARVVENNLVNSTLNSEMVFRGIDIENSLDCDLNCNEIEKFGVAINFFDDCGTSKLRRNIMTDYYTGIWLNGVGNQGARIDTKQGVIIGSSKYAWDNEWIPASQFSSLKVDGELLIGSGQPTFISWYHQGSNSALVKYSPNPWKGNLISPEPNVNTASPICNDFTRYSSNRVANFGSVVGDSLLFLEYESENRYLSMQNAFQAMRFDSTLLYQNDSLDADFQSFFNRMDTSNIGLFLNIRNIAYHSPDSANMLIAGISDTNNIESKQKAFYELFFDSILINDTISSSDSSIVENITNGSRKLNGESFHNSLATLSREVHPPVTSSRVQVAPAPKKDLTFQNSISQIKVHPNPTSGKIVISTVNGQIILELIEVYNSVGKKLLQSQCNSNSIELDVSLFDNGIYFIRAIVADGFCETKYFNLIK